MDRDPDSCAISIVVLITSLPVVVATVLSGRPFGASPTVCLVPSALSIGSLVRDHRDSKQFPVARVRRRKR